MADLTGLAAGNYGTLSAEQNNLLGNIPQNNLKSSVGWTPPALVGGKFASQKDLDAWKAATNSPGAGIYYQTHPNVPNPFTWGYQNKLLDPNSGKSNGGLGSFLGDVGGGLLSIAHDAGPVLVGAGVGALASGALAGGAAAGGTAAETGGTEAGLVSGSGASGLGGGSGTVGSTFGAGGTAGTGLSGTATGFGGGAAVGGGFGGPTTIDVVGGGTGAVGTGGGVFGSSIPNYTAGQTAAGIGPGTSAMTGAGTTGAGGGAFSYLDGLTTPAG